MNNHEIILSGINMDLTEAIKSTVHEKMEKLFKHEERIIRLRVELEYHQNRSHQGDFVAKGHIEINGPTMVISVATDNLYKSIDELTDKLDRKLRRRARMHKVRRHKMKPVDIPAVLPKVVAA